MAVNKIVGIVVFYLVVGLMLWLNIKTENGASLKTIGRKKWREPRFFKIVPFWLLFWMINLSPWKWKIKEWFYK